ncbi:MAG: 8-amino-7-oxononanoate synthase [Ktedonobacteraceae bacterium]|nr:8-amino-7-oxononanoate synthase [Ktedonobacteraceae bacterium]
MNPKPLQFMEQRLDVLRSHHLYRQLRTASAGSEAWLTIEGCPILNLSSNNYLGLASHPDLKAAIAAAAIEGGGMGSSRLIAGSSEQHHLLEGRFAHFKRAESALLFTSGYTANVGVLTSLAGPDDLIFSDELNHASIIDGCRLSRACCQVYPHADVAALQALFASSVQSGHTGKRIVVTDTVFSMDGDRAPLQAIADLCRRYDAILVVDEAHATGCIGPGGRGLVAEANIQYAATISMSTLSKALGSFGAFITGPALVKEYLINVARNFIFTTALPPAVIAASLAAVNVLEQQPALVEQLQENATFFRAGLQAMGFNTLTSSTHIIPILIGDSALTLEMSGELLRNGIFAVAIRPPTVPANTARIRTSIMATHSRSDLEYALSVFERVGKRLHLL